MISIEYVQNTIHIKIFGEGDGDTGTIKITQQDLEDNTDLRWRLHLLRVRISDLLMYKFGEG